MPRRTLKPTLLTRLKKHTPELIISLGLFLLLLNGVHSIFRDRALSLDAQTVEAYAQPQAQRPPKPSHIFIRWFVDSDITDAVYTGSKWTVSADSASYLLQSARPGEGGNIIIYGHNTRPILGNIRALKGNETITLTTEDGTEHLYRVDSLTEVAPNQTQLLQPTDTEVLTIYTCSGIFDSQRFIVRALPFDSQ